MAGRPPFARRGEQGGRIATSGRPFFAKGREGMGGGCMKLACSNTVHLILDAE